MWGRLHACGHIVRYDVDSLTPEQITQKIGPKEVQCIQIVVESLDNKIVKSLPVGVNGLLPIVILYDNHEGKRIGRF